MSQDPSTPFETSIDRVFENGAQSTVRKKDEFTVHRYPLDIGQGPEHPNYIMFFISQRKSDIREGTPTSTLNIDYSNQFNPAKDAKLAKGAFTLVPAAAALRGAGAVRNLSREIFSILPDPKTLGKAAPGVDAIAEEGVEAIVAAREALVSSTALGVAASIGVAAGGTTVATLAEGRDKVLLKNAIALYLPDVPSTKYKANWNDQDIGMLGVAGEALNNIGDTFSGDQVTEDGFLGAVTGRISAAVNSIKNVAGGAAVYGIKGINKLPGFSELGNFEAAITSGLGKAINPYKVQMFNNMGYRTFSFSYVFLPKSETEYLEVQNIVKLFKLHMHPTVDPTNQLFMGYPSEFSIGFFHKGEQNKELFRISSCALTDMSVDYGGTDFTTFKPSTDSNGNVIGRGRPTEIQITLNFLELELLTQERIKDGNY